VSKKKFSVELISKKKGYEKGNLKRRVK
jgi:hypothetical protein